MMGKLKQAMGLETVYNKHGIMIFVEHLTCGMHYTLECSSTYLRALDHSLQVRVRYVTDALDLFTSSVASEMVRSDESVEVTVKNLELLRKVHDRLAREGELLTRLNYTF